MFETIVKVLLPIALILVMIGVGISLEVKDFKRVAQCPKGFFAGAACQLILLPLLAIGVILATGLTGALAMGVLVIALCPGGVTSNLFTYLAKGDVGLSVSLTAVIGLVTPFTLPLIVHWGLDWLDLAESFQLPVLKTITQLIVVTILPIFIGMAIRSKVKRGREMLESIVRKVSVAVLGMVILAAYLNLGFERMMQYTSEAGLACILLNIIGMCIGLGVAYLIRLNLAQKTCVMLEVGLQNGTIALFVTSTLFESAEMTIAPSVYSLWMMVPASLVVFLSKRRNADLEPLVKGA